jgi:protein SCO1/2
MNRRTILTSAVVAIVALGLGAAIWLASTGAGRMQFHALDITGAEYAQGFDLVDFNGQPRTLADFKGKVVVLFFGYTQCPDVCPTTMGEMVEVKRKLGAEGDKLQVLFVSVDPARDTPEVLKAYMGHFDPSFVALYAQTPAQLAALARDFKVYYQKVDGKTPTSYTMDHTAASFIYDTQGRVRLYSRFGTSTDDLTADIQRLLGGA